MLSVTDENVAAITGAVLGALILAENGCGACGGYTEEVQRLEDGGRLEGVVVGRMVLDQPGSSGFKRANPWLRDVELLPYTVIYGGGEKVDEFAASRGWYLLEWLARDGLASPAGSPRPRDGMSRSE